MKIIRNFALLRAAVLLVLALGLSSSHANAENMLVGSFSLPADTHWGRTVLPAGDYTVTVESEGAFPMVTVRSADGKWAGMFLAQSISETKNSGTPVLTLTREGDGLYVSSLAVGAMQEVLEYRVPKTAEASTIASGQSGTVMTAASHH